MLSQNYPLFFILCPETRVSPVQKRLLFSLSTHKTAVFHPFRVKMKDFGRPSEAVEAAPAAIGQSVALIEAVSNEAFSPPSHPHKIRSPGRFLVKVRA